MEGCVADSLQNFIPDLKDHIIARLLGKEFNGEEHNFTEAQRNSLTIAKNRIYRHLTLRINYTTYDMRRDQDCINVRSHSDVMVLAPDEPEAEEKHPYWYARICGIYHAEVFFKRYKSKPAERRTINFLWVRWFGRQTERPGGFKTRRLNRVGFIGASTPGAFGFLDPELIVRAVHMIPDFHGGRVSHYLPASSLMRTARKHEDQDGLEWEYYYVNR